MDLTRYNESCQKKSVSVMVAPITEGTGNGEISAATANHLIAKLPAKSHITNAYVFVATASDAATSAAATVGTASGGAQILSAVNLKTTGKQGTFAGMTDTATGVDVYLNLTYTGAATNVGRYRVVIEYLEYTKNTGEYTKFN